MSTKESITVRLDALSTEIAMLGLDGLGSQDMWKAQLALTIAVCYMKLTWVEDQQLRTEYLNRIDECLEDLNSSTW